MKNYFNHSEFTARGFPIAANREQKILLSNLRDNILNPIRAAIRSPMLITDCCRDLKKVVSLRKRGYNPSATSDHFFGLPVPTTRKRDIMKYGNYFKYSAGAADFVTPKKDMLKVFEIIQDLEHQAKIRPGQVILEFNPVKKRHWIHIANPKDLVLSDFMIYELQLSKAKFLTSVDNGRSYQLA